MNTLRDLRRRFVAGLILVPLYPFILTSRFFLRRAAKTSSIHGLTIFDISRANEDAHVKSLMSALEIVREYAPWHYSRAVRDLRRVLIGTRKEELPRFDSEERALSVGSEFLLSESTFAIATMLGYVTTSARLYRRFGVTRRENAVRRYRICLESALAFARRLPDSEEIVRTYTVMWDSGFWNSDGVQARQILALQERGMPRLGLRFLKWLQR